ncbi:MAG: NAD-dependent epimerase/dehydratase family protein, partial [Gammaproteobacteria bacterium]|nr:NAD-dependent epimerase/dehydratase family protein [Gammaproteobacteria bacterium]
MKKILITGANGFVGQVLIRSLLNLGYNIRVVTRSQYDPSNMVLGNNCEVYALQSDLNLI